jgi:Tol biopolymer transport system component
MLESSRRNCGALCLIVAGFLAPSPVAEQTGTVPALTAKSRIAFASYRDGNWEIYLTDPDGRHQTRLTRGDAQDRFPLWSPDQSKLAFGSQVGGTQWELWVMDVAGTKARSLASQIVAKGSRQWSHDGTRIVFAAAVDRDIEIFSVDVDNGTLMRLTTSPGDDRDPSWSSDDSHVAFSSTRDGNSEIHVMRADGSDRRRLTQNTAPAASPAWSPNGSTIAFVSGRDGDRDVYMIRPDEGRLERLTRGAHVTNDALRWSPDGSHIAVQTADHGNYDIQVLRTADHVQTGVVGTAGFDGQFSWSPDGDFLAFISDRDGFDAVYVTDVTGKHLNRLTGTPSLNPEWSP